MNRFYLKPKLNPVFKVAQPLPMLMAGPGLKHAGPLPCRFAAPVASPEDRLNLPAVSLDKNSCNPANERPRYNSLCKNFAFTSLPQLV
jgi:hypothetical protein